jgi:hypothetical protein
MVPCAFKTQTAQIRTFGLPAYDSYLGCMAGWAYNPDQQRGADHAGPPARRAARQGWVLRRRPGEGRARQCRVAACTVARSLERIGAAEPSAAQNYRASVAAQLQADVMSVPKLSE